MLNTVPIFREDASLLLPPQNIEAEEVIIGGLLLDGDAIARIESILPDPRAFYIHSHRVVYAAVLALRKASKAIDLMTVANALKDSSSLKQAGGQSALVQFLDRCISTANLEEYAKLVADKYTRRRLAESGREIERTAMNTAQPLLEVLAAAEQSVFAISQQTHTSKVMSLADIASDAFSDIEARSQGLVQPGLASGYYDLDAMTQGFQPTDLIVAAGRPAMGKTALICGIATNSAVAQNRPILICSLEMGKKQLLHRMISPLTKIESGRLRTGRLAAHEWEPLGHALDQLSQLPIFIDDSPALIRVNEIASKARKLKSEKGDLGTVIIDYLQLMEGEGNNRVEELAGITRALKGLAKELEIPIILLSQLSRGVESRTNKRPMMSDLRDSGCIEQDADLILMLYREEYYDPDTPDKGIAEVILTKHRNGPTGTVKLLFDAQYTQFLNRSSLR
ncbi:MAG: replicative DNA helicase [Leptolyngbya foveolarum]|uniref:Replicative DNA helicase n=1 Tax=Leptolyngbya foveolarum TaxID=47253 RepID=A0A2W4TVJ2_9CYAN|nr:MAG: replicative DNA helicase [Leptolyngbya foveolarum]